MNELKVTTTILVLIILIGLVLLFKERVLDIVALF